jgi:HEAT repeat protein
MPHDIPQLLSALHGGDYVASLLAIDRLVDHGGEDAVVPLIEAVFSNDAGGGSLSRALRCRALSALAQIAPDDDMVVGTFLAISRDPDPRVASVAIEALTACRAHSARAVTALRPCLDHDDTRVRSAARGALSQLLGVQVGSA